MPKIKLKPCPFCGRKPYVFLGDNDAWFVQCKECSATIGSHPQDNFTEKLAISAWNRRV